MRIQICGKSTAFAHLKIHSGSCDLESSSHPGWQGSTRIMVFWVRNPNLNLPLPLRGVDPMDKNAHRQKKKPTDRFTLDQLKCFPLCVHCHLLRFPQSFQIRLGSSQNGGDVRMDVICVVIRGAGDAATHPTPYVGGCSKQALETHVQNLYHQKRATIT